MDMIFILQSILQLGTPLTEEKPAAQVEEVGESELNLRVGKMEFSITIPLAGDRGGLQPCCPSVSSSKGPGLFAH